jgi:type II secretory pathway pseudopilin PulG
MRRHPGRRPSRGRQLGITYLLLLSFVVVMGLALAAAATVWHTDARREKERELLFIGKQFRDALRSYASEGAPPQYPESLEQLVLDERVPVVRRHLRRIYADPLTGSAEWGLIRRGGRIIGVYSLAEGTPLLQAGFPEDWQQFAAAQAYADWRFQAEATAAEAPGAPGAPEAPGR